MTLTGSCLCGELKYTIDAEPVKKALCHCLQCRKVTGSTYGTTVMFPRPSFKLADPSSPHLKTYTFTQESGIPFTIQFCSNCGSGLGKTTEHDAFKEGFILFAGTLDDKEKFEEIAKPEVELWSKYKTGWVEKVQDTVLVETM